MKTNLEILQEIKVKEQELNLYGIKVFGLSLWRFVRYSARVQQMAKINGYIDKTKKDKVSIIEVFKNYCLSFIQIVNLLIKGKKYKNVVFAFPRLIQHNGKYFDKFTDPVIAQTSLKDNTLVFQRHLGTKHYNPRLAEHNDVIISDFIDYSTKFLSLLLFPIFYFLYRKEIKKLEKQVSKYFTISNKFSLFTAIKISGFYLQMKCWKFILGYIKSETVLLVDREIFLPHIVASKKNDIVVAEFQHGIVHSEQSAIFTGNYEADIDPDYFLTFGEKWLETPFGMTADRRINIGWAYKSYMKDKVQNDYKENGVLVVSAPHLTDNFIKTTIELAEEHKNYQFTLRLHPQEHLSDVQLEQIKPFENIKVDDKKIDSLVSVLNHQYCIGENSSVIYEALDYGKIVGKIMYNGMLSDEGEVDKKISGIFHIKNKSLFNDFVNQQVINTQSSFGVYDDFNVDAIENILRK